MRDRKFRLKTGGSGSKIGLFLTFGLIIGASVISAILMIAEKDLSHIGLVLFWEIGGCLVLAFVIFALRHHFVTVIMNENGVQARFFFRTICAYKWDEINHIFVTDKNLPKEWHTGFVVVSATEIVSPINSGYLTYDFRTEIAIPITSENTPFLEEKLSPFSLTLSKTQKGWDYSYRSMR